MHWTTKGKGRGEAAALQDTGSLSSAIDRLAASVGGGNEGWWLSRQAVREAEWQWWLGVGGELWRWKER